MFCKKCGSTLRENAKFCGSCGAVVEVEIPKADAGNTNPGYQGGNNTVSAKKPNKAAAFAKAAGEAAGKVNLDGIKNKMPKKMPKLSKKLLPILGGVAVVALVLILVVSGVFSGPAGQVTKAAMKSVDAYMGVVDDLNLPDLVAIADSGKYNQELKAWVSDGDAEGLGIRATFAYNQSGKEAAFVVTPFFEDTDLITGQMKIEGSKIYLGCPELMEKTYLMVDTQTLGADLEELGAYGVDDLSFNLFEMIDQLQAASELTKDQKKALEKGAAALVKSMEVEKDGKKDIKINGNKIPVTLYNVVIPQDALEDYLDVLEDVIKDMDTEAVVDILEDAGFPVDDMDLSMDNDALLDVIGGLKDLVDEIEDLELQVGLNGGYVVQVKWEFEQYGYEYEMILQLGGGDNYVDDLSLEVVEDGDTTYEITSTGNHAMKKGVFTDETTIVEYWGGNEYDVLVSELSWKPSAKSDNFEWNLEVGSDALDIEGTLLCSKDSLTFIAPIEMDGDELSVSYTLSGYKAPSIKTGTVLKLSEMDEDDLEDLWEMIDENGSEWGETMEDEFPEFTDFVEELMWYLY